MSKKDDEAVVVCGPGNLSPDQVIPGSLKVKCADCGIPVWMSPASLNRYQEYKTVTLVCMDCGMKRAEVQKAKTGVFPQIEVPGDTLRELRDLLGDKRPPEAS
jgi:DNA-directed RNA polymerase subunit RPC12/RpoP